MPENRRPLSSRRLTIFHRLAAFLVKRGLHPNHISVASALFGIFGCGFFAFSADASPLRNALCLFLAAACIQSRLLCNLVDGLMAVEGGLKTPTGELFNDVPDRISDAFLLLGAGLALRGVNSWAVDLGWLAAVVAILTAYIRVLGASLTGAHDYSGPMAKPQRMFFLTMGALCTILEDHFEPQRYFLSVVLIVIVLGSIVTCIRRLQKISTTLRQK